MIGPHKIRLFTVIGKGRTGGGGAVLMTKMEIRLARSVVIPAILYSADQITKAQPAEHCT